VRRLWLTGALLLAGCSLAPSDEVMKALSANERSWCVSVSSVYGTLRAGGTGILGGQVTCTQEGLSVKDDAARLGITVPITLAPTVGAPTPTK